ncbi:MAG: hypothetical protein IKW83_02925 [Muribaculaceae bacterium]|nr:hypothetical protein [Muribaculaceae bacterium]
MKKIIYLLTLSIAIVNVSCASLFSAANGDCSCTCPACLNCAHKHHALTAEQLAKQDSLNAVKSWHDAELDSLLNMDYTIVHYDSDPVPYKWDPDEVISTPQETLMALFKTGNPTTGGDTEYVLKEISTSTKVNDIYFYFNTKDGVPEPLRFVVHFYADDQINFNKLLFNIDGFKYEYVPTGIKRTNDGKFYSENFDNAMNEDSRDIVAGLAHCMSADVLLVSERGVNHRIYFSEAQLKHFKETYELYRKMGGKL